MLAHLKLDLENQHCNCDRDLATVTQGKQKLTTVSTVRSARAWNQTGMERLGGWGVNTAVADYITGPS